MIQKRAIERAKIITDTAIDLLAVRGADEIGLAEIAEQSGIPLPSVYNFFPNKNALFKEVARQYHEKLIAHTHEYRSHPADSWQRFFSAILAAGVDFQNANPAMMQLLLGSGVSGEVKHMDIQGSKNIAAMMAEEFVRRYRFDNRPELEKKLSVSIAIADGVWGLSFSVTGAINDEYKREGIRAAISYLRLYLPEYLDFR